MQLSNRLTFSLASLFLIFALAFSVMPVIAHESVTHDDGNTGHPMVTISEASYPADGKKARNNYRVKIVATVNGSSNSDRFATATNELSEVIVRPFTADGAPLTAVTLAAGTTNVKTTDKHEWELTIDLSTVTTARSIEVIVPADAVNGERAGALGGNEMVTESFTNLSPVLAYSATLEAAPKKNADDTPIPGRYTVTLKFLNDGEALAATDDAVSPEPTVSDIMVMPMAGARAVDSAGATVTGTITGDAATGIYMQDYQLTFGATEVTLSLIEGYATNAPSTKLPPPVTATQNPPEAMITVSGHDPAERTYRVEVMFTPAADSLGDAGAAITGFDYMGLDIKDASTPAAEVLTTKETERKRDNSYTAILKK